MFDKHELFFTTTFFFREVFSKQQLKGKEK